MKDIQRTRAAGIYIVNDKILLVKHKKNNREYYLLPGGGVDYGEEMKTSLRREWLEELTLKANVGEHLFCGEVIPESNSGKKHIFQHVFRILSIEGKLKVNPDGVLFDFAWVSKVEFQTVDFFPACKEQVNAIWNDKRAVPFCSYFWLP